MDEEIELMEPLGVSAATPSSRLFAEVAASLNKKRVLDLGTGTGYCAILMAKHGSIVDAVDISDRALAVAEQNAKTNAVAPSITIYKSDLFANVDGVFDLIVWNAPVGNARGNAPADFVKSIIRGMSIIYKLAQRVTYKLFLKQRLALNEKVMKGAYSRLSPGGLLLLLITDAEESAIMQTAKSLGYNARLLDSGKLRETVKGKFVLLEKQTHV